MLNLENYVAIPQEIKNGIIRSCTLIANDQFDSIEKLTEIMNNDVNTVWISFRCKISGKTFAIGNYYREYSTIGVGRNDIETQLRDLDYLEKQLEKCKKFNVTIVTGDWNCDLNRMAKDSQYDRKRIGTEIVGLMKRNGLKHIDFGITRIGNKNRNEEDGAIDFMFVSNTEIISTKMTTDEYLSHDHRLIYLDVKTERKQRNKKKIKFRKKITDKIACAFELAQELNDANIMMENNPNKIAKMLWDTIEKILNKHSPWAEKEVKEGSRFVPDPEIEELQKVKRKLANFYKFSGEERIERQKEHNRVRNKILSLIKKKERQKVQEKLDTENIWKITERIIHPNQLKENITLKVDDKEIKDPGHIATILNEYYVEKIKNLVEGIDDNLKKDPYQKLTDFMKDKDLSFEFKPIGSAEISKIIRNMKKSRATGMDEVSSEFIKEYEYELLPYLVHLVNRSIITNTFPDAWKIAKVIPLYKNKGSKFDKKNYRPVSNLITFSKILESVLEKQLRDYFEVNALIVKNQYGFRKYRGTNLALLEATTKWKELEAGGKSIGICLFDLSAAFDCLDKDILDKKLEIYGVKEGARKLIKSYLTGRLQVVEIDGNRSNIIEIVTGSPQGSVISPLLYIIFVNDLPLWLDPDVEIVTFADDTSMFIGGEEDQEIIIKLERNSLTVFEYFSSNNLVANKDKTCFMFMDKNQNRKDQKELNIGGTIVKESESDKLLGLRIDRKIEWKEQVKDVENCLNHRVYKLKKIRPYVSGNQLNTIANGIAMSKIQYSCSSYANSYVDNTGICKQSEVTKRLQKCQNNVLRAITGNRLSSRVPISKMLDDTGFLSVNQMIAKQQLLCGWNVVKNKIEPLNEMVCGDQRDELTSLRSSSLNHIRPNCKNDFSFPKQLKQLWNHNKLDAEFRNTDKKSVAKRIAKSFVKETVPKLPWKK